MSQSSTQSKSSRAAGANRGHSRSPAESRSHKRTTKKHRKSNGIPVLLGLLAAVFAALVLFRLVLSGGISGRNEPPVPTAEPTPPLPPVTLEEAGFGWENGYKTYTTSAGSADLGIDVSQFQSWIDWSQVSNSGVDYAIIRVGYQGYANGNVQADDYFSYNLESAKNCGMDVGLYFFSQALNESEARVQAQWILEQLDGVKLEYPIYFDWEPITTAEARTDTISSSELTACAKAFCDTIIAGGYEAGVYFNLSMATHYYHIYELGDYSFWLAEYQDTPSFPFAIDQWQYSAEGTVPGIDTIVDMNLSFRSIS